MCNAYNRKRRRGGTRDRIRKVEKQESLRTKTLAFEVSFTSSLKFGILRWGGRVGYSSRQQSDFNYMVQKLRWPPKDLQNKLTVATQQC